MWTGEDNWSVAFIVSAVILIVILVVGIIAWRIGTVLGSDEHYDASFNRKLWHYGTLIVLGIVFVSYAFAWFPYKGEYHKYSKIQGTVESVDSRLVSVGSNSMEDKFVITYESGIQVGCLDTRCAAIQPGDFLTLNCIRRYEWFSTSGYDCRFVGDSRDN